MKYQILNGFKIAIASLSLILAIILFGCEENDFLSEDETTYAPEETSTEFFETTTESNEQTSKKISPDLIRNVTHLNNKIFYLYYFAPRVSDAENHQIMQWEFVAGENKEHNEWIDTQTFTSLFRYGEYCIRTGYYNESGQWGVTFFSYYGLYTAYVGSDQSIGQTISYAEGDDAHWLLTPDAFGAPNDYSVEISSFDEDKETVTLTFTSPDGESVIEVYFNYVSGYRCDENGASLLDENGNPYYFDFQLD